MINWTEKRSKHNHGERVLYLNNFNAENLKYAEILHSVMDEAVQRVYEKILKIPFIK